VLRPTDRFYFVVFKHVMPSKNVLKLQIKQHVKCMILFWSFTILILFYFIGHLCDEIKFIHLNASFMSFIFGNSVHPISSR
jgi:hypothetical protein